MAKFRIRCDQC